MCALGDPRIIPTMTRTVPAPKLLLVADTRPAAERGRPRVRRYRLARLRFDGRTVDPATRFDHLKRVYD